LSKSKPTNKVELFRQPIFGNPLITNHESKPLGLIDKSDGNAFVSSGCPRVRDLWDLEEQNWKGLPTLGMSFHPSNKQCKEIITSSIPWNPVTSTTAPGK
jgi:hypothetical protein